MFQNCSETVARALAYIMGIVLHACRGGKLAMEVKMWLILSALNTHNIKGIDTPVMCLRVSETIVRHVVTMLCPFELY